MNCPNCGAAVTDESKFCNYCGAKLPDDTKRVEVNINKRIEDVAEMKRADYETDESKLKQRKMQAEFRAKKVRRWACLILLAISVVFALPAIFNWTRSPALILIGLFGGVFAGLLIFWIIYLLITGKW